MGNGLELNLSERTALRNRFLRLRKKLEMSQMALGEFVGLTGATVWNVESMRFGRVSPNTMKKLREAEERAKRGVVKAPRQLKRVPR